MKLGTEFWSLVGHLDSGILHFEWDIYLFNPLSVNYNIYSTLFITIYYHISQYLDVGLDF